MIEAKLVDVNRELAESWLAKNNNNRHLKKRVIYAYMRDMQAGNWHVTGDSIKFGEDGELEDGQHRLHAVVAIAESDPKFSVPMLVVTGLKAEAKHVMDTGAKRTIADSLQLDGVANAHTIAAAVRIVIFYERNDLVSRTSSVSTSEVRDWLKEHPDFGPFVGKYQHMMRQLPGQLSPILAALWFCYLTDDEAADDFAYGLATQADLPYGDPRLSLHKRFFEMKYAVGYSARTRTTVDYFGMMIIAWNQWRAGQKVTKVQRPKGGWSTHSFPSPK